MTPQLPPNQSQWVERVCHDGQMLALIIRTQFDLPGIHFFTEPEASQQLAFIRHPSGRVIEAHYHIPRSTRVELTQEVLFIKRGRLRVDFYTHQEEYLESREVGPGDFILLAEGAHGFEVLEEIEMVEVKQGPYAGENEKVRLYNAQPGNWKKSQGT